MTLPDYQSLMGPVLNELVDGRARHIREVRNALAAKLSLPAGQLQVMLPSGHITLWSSRVHWATQYLYQAGAGVGNLADPDTVRGSVAVLIEELLDALDDLD